MIKEKRILGLDFGDKTVGVALSDPMFWTAQGVEIVRREKPTKLRKTLARIVTICEPYEIPTIVLGYPMMLDGTEGERCQKTLEFKELLQNRFPEANIVLRDERLTTVEAYETMEFTGVKKDKQKDYVDELAAMFILQGYLDEMDK